MPAPGTSLGAVGRQNVPDKIKKLSNVIIPDAAKPPVLASQAGGTAPSAPVVTPAPQPQPTAAPPQAPVGPTPAPIASIPGPRTLPRGLTGFGIQGEFPPAGRQSAGRPDHRRRAELGEAADSLAGSGEPSRRLQLGVPPTAS